MRRSLLILFVIFIIPALSFGTDENILARVGNKVLTKADFDVFVNYFSAERKTDLSKDEKFKKDLLDILVRRMAMAEMARKKGVDKKQDVLLLKEFTFNGILATELIKQEVTDKLEVSEEDMRIYYQKNTAAFKSPEMVRARHILIKVDKTATAEEKKKAKEKAEKILQRIKAGENFADLASEYSDDPGSNKKNGDLGFMARGRTVKPFDAALFSLKPGEVSDIVETAFGYHIIKVEEKKEAGLIPFEEAKNQVKVRVIEELKKGKTKSLTEEAMQEAGVEVHPELLNSGKKEEAQSHK